MRILFSSSVPWDERLGAAQATQSLAEACAALGHEVETWAPTAGAAPRWWKSLRHTRKAFHRFLAHRPRYDLIDSVSWMMGSGSRRATVTACVRSIQPELGYLYLTRPERRSIARRVAENLYREDCRRLIERGWRDSDRILALGSLEYAALRSSHPQFAAKIGRYFLAPPEKDRKVFREIAAKRSMSTTPAAQARYLWVGRWEQHKGKAAVLSFAATFLQKNPNSSLTVAGTGVDVAADFPPELVSGGRVRVLPSFERAELPGLLSSHDAGLFTSELEGWGLSLQEMLESGMDVYAAPTGAVPDLREWLPSKLHAFPPNADVKPVPALPATKLFARYHERFSWKRLGAEYLEQALSEGHAP